jgi:hypothetical protein
MYQDEYSGPEKTSELKATHKDQENSKKIFCF